MGRIVLRESVLMLSMLAGAGAMAAVPVAPVQLVLRPDVQAESGDWPLANAVEVPEPLRATLRLDRLRMPAPQPGHVDRWRPEQIERLLRARADGVLPPITWTGAGQVLVTRRVQALAPEALLGTAIVAWSEARPGLQKDVIEPARPLEPIDIGTGAYRLQARRVDQPERAAVVVWVDVVMDRRVVRSVSVPLRNMAPDACLVAKRFLDAGQYVTAADFSQSGAADTCAVLPGAVRRVRLRHALRQGEALTVAALEPAEAVRRGDAVRIATRTGGMTLEANGTAADDALPGQLVAVQWAAGRELVRGRLLEGHKVEIE